MKNFAWLALCLSFASACESDDNPEAASDTKAQGESRGDAAAERDDASQRGDAGASDDTAAASDSDAQGGKSLYVIATAITTDDTASTYVAALDSLESDKLDLSQAREFGGWSDIGVVGDWVFVSSGEAPEISRFTVDEERQLQEAGSISFGDYT
ncbi:MAG TPA: hypothetical protein VMF89_05275, partial [Polyangiales bacterium]|nr:hypothetical protein [Polyangiales bacterium]